MTWPAGWPGAGTAARVLLPLIARLGIRPPRDLSRLHAALYARGLATPFGAPPAARPSAGGPDELAAVAARVRALAG